MLVGVGGQHSRTRLHTLTSTTAFVVATLEAFHVMTHIHQHEAIKDIFFVRKLQENISFTTFSFSSLISYQLDLELGRSALEKLPLSFW